MMDLSGKHLPLPGPADLEGTDGETLGFGVTFPRALAISSSNATSADLGLPCSLLRDRAFKAEEARLLDLLRSSSLSSAAKSNTWVPVG